MSTPRVIKVKENILAKNRIAGESLRADLTARQVALVNIMASPGSGKTTLIQATVDRLASHWSPAVIEADVDSSIDAQRLMDQGTPAVQIQTGGFCHVDADMVTAALSELDLTAHGLVFLENVGNLICTAEHDTGAHLNVVVLSVPEGDDKPAKYPGMFQGADVVLVSKMDYLQLSDFDIDRFEELLRKVNASAPVFPLSAKTGEGLKPWMDYLVGAITPVSPASSARGR